MFLLQGNMDIKYIGSGQAAKVLVYYVTDYITKTNLQTHVGLGALEYAIKQHDKKYSNDSMSSRSTQEQYLLTKCVNAYMGKQEMSHQQIMSSMLLILLDLGLRLLCLFY
ncbi:hypothetical protein SERLA73DRAFT_57420 [Serpula lacrymans var. lacrymans S7.3]|uniref:Uncharacterized protein n=1 Tax=Serpula lacrymans var. lacrymans (strain S7.3) TaxID=936435 RepID=F8Q3H6_SERL3|nr:hypothetical protein SERLA73DRAFT_57420 [Serpula lacrymans var. lacrymans S7.3]